MGMLDDLKKVAAAVDKLPDEQTLKELVELGRKIKDMPTDRTLRELIPYLEMLRQLMPFIDEMKRLKPMLDMLAPMLKELAPMLRNMPDKETLVILIERLPTKEQMRDAFALLSVLREDAPSPRNGR